MASGGHSSSQCAGLSLSQPLLLRSTGSRRAGSVVVAHGPSCSVACGVFPDQGSNPCPLHWQADSQPPRHQGSPLFSFLLVWREWLLPSFLHVQLKTASPPASFLKTCTMKKLQQEIHMDTWGVWGRCCCMYTSVWVCVCTCTCVLGHLPGMAQLGKTLQ